MRATLALFAIRFGGWLLAKAAGQPIVICIEIWDEEEGLSHLLTKTFGAAA
jgi:hypothetical protein